VAGGSRGRRTYARDNRGRFASTGTARSRPAPKQAATRGTNRLTRNNSGQIVGVGRNGATARGGRIRTGAGNQRATQTARLARMGGTIAKPKGLKPGALTAKAKAKAAKPATPRGPATSRLRPGELMNAVARPVGTMARPRRAPKVFGKKKGENIELAQAGVTAAGFNSRVTNRRRDAYSGSPASANTAFKLVSFNKADSFWANPRTGMIAARRNRQLSTSDPRGIVFHEIGHLRDKSSGFVNTKDGGLARRDFASPQTKALAGRVSRYATTSPREFTAETYAGLRTGRRYDFQVMRAYREAMGLSPTPAARRRSRVRRAKP
jgi:hypothetical protein